MAELPVSIVDYGAGNLRSVARALERVGARVRVTDDPSVVRASEVLVVPGQGAARDAMANLTSRDLAAPILDHIRAGKPYVGICLGLQILLERSDEHGGVDCLGLVPGRVRRFPAGLKVPQMGWNTVHWTGGHPLHEAISQDTYFYFLHSYYADVTDPAWLAGTTEYGVTYASAIARDNVVALQFHPEKSAERGLQLYANVLRWAARPSVPLTR